MIVELFMWIAIALLVIVLILHLIMIHIIINAVDSSWRYLLTGNRKYK